MKVSFLSLVAIASVVVAEQGVFSFKDVRGYEKCLATDHLVETTATEGGSQKRFMNQHEVGLRCIESAEKLLAKEKDKNKLLEFVKTTKRNHGHENSLGIIHRLVTVNRAACNDMEIYGVLLKALAHPKDYPSASDSYYDGARKVVQVCLGDKEFRTDFLEEKDNSNSYIASNACEILVQTKQVKSCKKG